MAFKSEDQVVTLIRAITAAMVNFQSYAGATFVSDFDTISDAIKAGDDAPEDQALYDALSAVQSSLGAAWTSFIALAQSSAPTLGRLGVSPNLSDPRLDIDYFRQYMTNNAKTFLDGAINKDTATVISGVSAGDGACVMSSLDPNGDKLDIGHLEDMRLVCIQDYSQGAAAGTEVFQIRGEDNTGKRPWEEGGSGTNGASYDYPYGNVLADFSSEQQRARSGGTITSISSSNGNFVLNGNFENPITGTGATKLPDWTINAGDTAITQETADPLLGVYSLLGDANFQMDSFFNQGSLRPRAGYGLAVKLERKNSADGTFTIKIMDSDEGTTHATLTVVLTTLSNDTPTLVVLDPFIIPSNAEDLKVQIQLASNTTGEIKFDDVICGMATLIDGYLIAIIDGTTLDANSYAVGRFKNGDEFLIQTSAGTAGEGEIQHYFFNRSFSRYMPSAEAPTWADPI